MCKSEQRQEINAIFDPFIQQIEQGIQAISEELDLNACKIDESKMLVGDITIYEIDEEHIEQEGSSEVILFVDNREKRHNTDGNYLFDRLSKAGLRVELKSLPLGDFLWVMRIYNDDKAHDDVITAT